MIVAVCSIASSVTQPVFGALAEDRSTRLVGATGVLPASLFLSLIGVAPGLAAVFALLIVGGMGSAALHPVGTAIAGGPTVPNRTLGVGLMVPGIVPAVLVCVLLPDWEPHGHRPLRALFPPAVAARPLAGA